MTKPSYLLGFIQVYLNPHWVLDDMKLNVPLDDNTTLAVKGLTE